MKELNNPAARFLKIINEGRSISKNYTCTQAWSELFDIPISNTPLLLNRIGKVLALPDEIERKINMLEGFNQSLLLKWRPRANAAINNINFQRNWATFLDVFDNEIIYGIEVCEDALSRAYPEKTFESDKISEISRQIADLIEFIENDSIDSISKNFILTSLYQLNNSIEELRICGVSGIEESFNTIIGTVIVNKNINITSKDSKSASKFWEILGRVAIILAIVTGPIAIGDKILNLLPENTECVEAPMIEDQKSIEV